MALQSGRAVSVRYKVQSGLGTPASGSGAKELPFAPSGGLNLTKATIADPTVRADGMTLLARHGSRSVAGSYDASCRLNALDEIFEAVLRGTWTASDTLDEADFTSLTTTTSTIVFASGSPITLGVRRGMVIRLVDHASAGNNGRNLTVTDVNATTITVAETLTLNATPDTDCAIVLPKYVYTSGVNRYFTIEQYNADIDQSLVGTDCVFSSLSLALQPDSTALLSIGVVGIDMASKTTGDSPVFTSPTTYATRSMVSTDAKIIVNGVAVTDLTGLNFAYDLTAATTPMVGTTTSPDVFKNQATLSGSFSALRSDLARWGAFNAETEIAIAFTLVEPESEPKDFVSFYIPLATYSSSDAPLGGDNAMIETLNFAAGVASASGTATTMLQVCTSGA